MAGKIFKLEADDLRAVIGGATYYSSINKLPSIPAAATSAAKRASPHSFDLPATR